MDQSYDLQVEIQHTEEQRWLGWCNLVWISLQNKINIDIMVP